MALNGIHPPPENGAEEAKAGRGNSAPNPAAKPVTFTVFKSSSPLSKSYTLAEGGGIAKTPAASMTEGRAKRLAVDFLQFGAELGRAGECVAFGYGLHDSATFGEAVKIGIAAKADPAQKVLARTREFFDYRPGPGVLMIDHDPHPDGPAVSPDALRGILAAVWPEFATAAMWVRGSLSAGVHREGEAPKSGRGFHLYFAVANTADVPRFGKVLFDRLWLAGYGFVALSAAGSFLVRAVIDGAVFDGERLDFVGKPVIGPELAFTPPDAAYHDGAYLDTQGLEDLTDAEQQQLAKWIDQAKQNREADRKAVRAQWEERHTKAMMERGIPEKQARAQLRRIAPDGRRFDLYRDFPLMFAQRGFASVGDVLANPAHFDGEACADPFEGVEYGRTTAKFYANAREGKPVINSQAHGGMKYFLHAEQEPAASRPEPRQEEPPFDAEYYEQLAPLADEDAALIDATPPIQQAPKREGKPASRRGLAGGVLQDPAAVAGRAATASQPGNNSRAHAPEQCPAL